MKINQNNIKNIELCYENCEVDTVDSVNLLGVNIGRKNKSPYTYKEQPTYFIKTFEIALKNTKYKLRRDLAQLTINYIDGSFNHFFITWGKNDCSHYESSLQKVHQQNNLMILTSNCESFYLNN